MESVTVNRFRDGLKGFVEQVISRHLPLRVTRRNGADFIGIAAYIERDSPRPATAIANPRRLKAGRSMHDV